MYRAIVRLDFEARYEVFDKPGEIYRLMVESAIPWDGLKDNAAKRSVGAALKTDKTDTSGRHMSAMSIYVEPTSLSIGYEDSKGLDLQQGGSSDSFFSLLELADQICSRIALQKILRAGFRGIHVGHVQGIGDGMSPFAQFYSSDMLNAVGASLGKPKDFGIAIDGEGTNKVKYHLRFGPFAEKNLDEHFQNVAPALRALEHLNLIVDADFYEENFALASRKLRKWVTPSGIAFANIRESIADLLKKNTGEGSK